MLSTWHYPCKLCQYITFYNGGTDTTGGTDSTSTINSGYSAAMKNCTNYPNIAIKYDHKALPLCEFISLNALLFKEKRGGVRTLQKML